MPGSETAEKVIAAIAKVKSLPPAEIGPATAFADINVDSLDAIEILFELEEAFDLTVPDEAVQGMERVEQVISAVDEALESRRAAAGGDP